MGKPKPIVRQTVLDIFQHFGKHNGERRNAFMEAAALKENEMRDAAQSGVLPLPARWPKIVKVSKNYEWDTPSRN